MKTQIRFAATRPRRDGTQWVAPGSIRGHAAASRQYMGMLYAGSDGDWRAGWRDARKDGYRVRRVRLEVLP